MVSINLINNNIKIYKNLHEIKVFNYYRRRNILTVRVLQFLQNLSIDRIRVKSLILFRKEYHTW